MATTKFKSKKFAGTESTDVADAAAAKRAKLQPLTRAAKLAQQEPPALLPPMSTSEIESHRVHRDAKEVRIEAARQHHVTAAAIKNMPAPSAMIASEFYTAYDHFNAALFANKLSRPVFNYSRLKKASGHYWPKQWSVIRGKGDTAEIALDPFRCGAMEPRIVCEVIVHEMIHQLEDAAGRHPKKGYHGKTWVAAMTEVGLKPVILDGKGKPTNKATGANSWQEEIKGGKFSTAADALLATDWKLTWTAVPEVEEKKKKAKKKGGAKAKHTCPKCENNAWGKPSMVIMCRGDEKKHAPTEMKCERGAFEDEGDDADGE